MKYKYCPECKKAYLKSRLEKDKCIYCGKTCEIVDVKRSGRYYLGYALMVIGAVVMLIIRLWLDNAPYLWIFGIVIVVAGVFLVMDASSKMAKKAAESVQENKEAE